MHQHRTKGDPSVVLFSNEHTVEPIRLTDYLGWAACGDEPQCGDVAYPLSLPPIQRGFVWKPRQIADLWDSLLREMPIGSLMLQRHGEEGLSVTISHSAERAAIRRNRPGFYLLDGQQRTLAMLLGWPEGPQDQGRRLWVDLGEDGKNGARFMLRITTLSQPFGFQRGTHEKLSRSERRQAYDSFCKKYPEHDGKPFHELPLDETRPWKAGAVEGLLFVQLRDVWRVVRSEGSAGWETICRDESARDRLHQLCGALCELEKSWIALVCVPKLDVSKEKELEDPAHHPLTMLFERIATGGTRLSSEDLLFSMIKQVYPESHNLVHKIHVEVGHLMTAPDYVMTALRLACAIQTRLKVNSEGPRATEHRHADNANPSAREFHSYLKDGSLLGNEQSPGPLRRLIMLPEGEAGNPLVRAFNELMNLLRYRKRAGQGELDTGLPLAMFPYLGRPLVQVLLLWFVQLFDKGVPAPKLLEASRGELVRFVLFWLLCNWSAKDSYDASEAAFEVLRECPEDEPFPGQKLYHRITEGRESHDPSFARLVEPSVLIEMLNLDPDSRLRTMSKRFKETRHEEDRGVHDYFDHFWLRKDLLLWLQRDYIEKSFGEYGFLAGRDEKSEDSVPYDFDHLVPQAHWSDLRSARLHENVSDKEVKDAFENRWARNSLGNAIGNYRVVDSSENRGRGDLPLEEVLSVDNWKQKFAFEPRGEELHWWLLASPHAPASERYIWGEERIKAFQAAIEHRTVDLYRRYFYEAGFSVWFGRSDDRK